MLIILLGGVITITQTLTPSYTLTLLQVYYCYLFGTSVLFLAFLCAYVTHHRPLLQLRRAFRSSRSLLSLGDSPTPSSCHEGHVHVRKQFSYDTVSTSHTSSFYLRLGALGFGIGSMIKIGLQLGEFVDAAVMAGCKDVLTGLEPLLQFIFTFLQLYLVFAYSKVCFHRWQLLVQFGMMHLLATNVCVWLQNLVEGIVIDIREQTKGHVGAASKVKVENNHDLEDSYVILKDDNRSAVQEATIPASWYHRCNYFSQMSTVNHASFPYLFPCSIQYSLICAGFAYVMWNHVGSCHERRGGLAGRSSKAKAQRVSVDCSGSSRGLFAGIFLLVVSVLSLIAFYILHTHEQLLTAAFRLEHVTNILLYFVCSLVVLVAFWRMRGLSFQYKRGTSMEDLLLLVSLTGIYAYAGFSLVAALYHTTVYRVRGLVVASCVLHVFQASVQTLFIRHALRRQARTRDHEVAKSGKECVTFLLVANVALWCIHTFEVQESEANPVQMQFYGVLAWNIFTHLASPLATFFRFHSSVCLSNIWKHAWKSRMRSASSLASLASEA